jgi:hypothetical protein
MIRFLLYIDPGSGSLFYQVILSVMLTGSIVFSRIKNFFKKKKVDITSEEETDVSKL